MKKKFFSIAKRIGIEILDYKSERTQIGTQMFQMKVRNENGITWLWEDCYFVGEANAREKILLYFEKDLKEASI